MQSAKSKQQVIDKPTTTPGVLMCKHCKSPNIQKASAIHASGVSHTTGNGISTNLGSLMGNNGISGMVTGIGFSNINAKTISSQAIRFSPPVPPQLDDKSKDWISQRQWWKVSQVAVPILFLILIVFFCLVLPNDYENIKTIMVIVCSAFGFIFYYFWALD